jgi:hypothetical protein
MPFKSRSFETSSVSSADDLARADGGAKGLEVVTDSLPGRAPKRSTHSGKIARGGFRVKVFRAFSPSVTVGFLLFNRIVTVNIAVTIAQ